jgi:hypothetical protein
MPGPIATDLARLFDPVALAPLVGMDPDPWQEKVLRSVHPRLHLNCSRQAGKSTVAALLAVWQAVYRAGSLTLMLSPSQRQSGELFRKALTFYRTLGRPVPSEAESALALTLENGSRIVSLPGTEATIRSYSAVALLVVDEAARVADETYHTVSPMLAVSGGRVIAMSTPFGRRGWWYSAGVLDTDEQWERYLVTAHDIPRISAEFLESERRSMGDHWFAQEYLGEYADTIDQLFTADQLDRLISADVVPLFGQAQRPAGGF